MSLTDTKIRNSKTQDKAYKLYDAQGLHLVINPTGSKIWRLKYHYLDREKLVSFGKYPAISLKDARERADAVAPSHKKFVSRLQKTRYELSICFL
jgi:hypothetical protein